VSFPPSLASDKIKIPVSHRGSYSKFNCRPLSFLITSLEEKWLPTKMWDSGASRLFQLVLVCLFKCGRFDEPDPKQRDEGFGRESVLQSLVSSWLDVCGNGLALLCCICFGYSYSLLHKNVFSCYSSTNYIISSLKETFCRSS
jgi:hypothetical protein